MWCACDGGAGEDADRQSQQACDVHVMVFQVRMQIDKASKCAHQVVHVMALQVTMQLDKNSKEAQKAAQRAAKPPPSSGLDAFLAEVEKKKKVGLTMKEKK
eukprot:scaffold35002_cov16-Tisochrysis_lutea.AAC.3